MGEPEKELEDALGLSYVQLLRLWIGWGPMKDILTKLWTDPAYFRGATRALIGVLAGLVLSGKIVLPDPIEGWAWNLATLWPAILALPAGQSNPPPEEIKAIAVDPTIVPKT